MEISYNVEAKVIDPKTGKVLAKKRIKGGTFLKNFSALCHLIFMRGDTVEYETVIDTTGTSRSLKAAGQNYAWPQYDPSATNKMKCCVGTSSAAFSRDQYGCQSPLATVVYSNYNLTDDGTKKVLSIAFSWLNDTGAAQNVAEVALILSVAETAGTVRSVAIARDVFSPAISVPAGSTLAVGYSITLPW
jgi:hypothetical protein